MDATTQIELWYRQYGHAVHRRCLRILGEESLAWDATQETFIRAHRGLSRFRGDSSALTWLFGIAERRCFTLLAKSRLRSDRLEAYTQAAGEPLAPSSVEAVLADTSAVQAVLQRVPDDVKTIAVLRYLDEWSIDEIAAHLKISGKTVGRKLVRLHRTARKVLRLADLPDSPHTQGERS